MLFYVVLYSQVKTNGVLFSFRNRNDPLRVQPYVTARSDEKSIWVPAPKVEIESDAEVVIADTTSSPGQVPDSNLTAIPLRTVAVDKAPRLSRTVLTSKSKERRKEKSPGRLEGKLPKEPKLLVEPKCETCSKSFASKRKLTVHMKYVHSSLRPFACKICGHAFKMKNALKKHVQVIHEGLYELLPCKVCGYKAKDKSRLEDHYVRRHTDIYATSCYICGMQLRFKRDLTTHINQIHSGPIVCERCGDVLPSYRSLCNHKKTHHAVGAKRNRNFKCGICSKGFASQESADAHKLKQHNDGGSCYCDHCGKPFTGKYALTHHIQNVHREDRPYSCPVCVKTFKMHSLLQLHLFTHTDVKPYRCDICGSAYTQRGSMMLHRRKHPGDLPPVPPIKLDLLLKSIQPKINQLAKGTAFKSDADTKSSNQD